MKQLFFLLVGLIIISCSSKSGKEAEEDSVVVEVEEVRVIDTLGIESLATIDVFNFVDSLNVILFNPYSDTIVLDNRYEILEKESGKFILNGKIFDEKIDPQSNITFRVSLGLDSVEYSKRKNYEFKFFGKSKYKDILYLDSTKLGNRYRYKRYGKYIYYLEPDTIIFPEWMLPVKDKTVPEVEVSTLDELEEASPKAEIIEENDSIAKE